ncbi:MAG TPA: twin-arginine translocase TatA/TatE family subunit [Candidatus Acidoferrales bacterium]|nr:twin-arginine translocase TatA/TatE family subunit [Candidatus Acidoferrales bacterium]
MLSLPHLVVLFVVALVIFGPEKLPELARMLGKATGEFRKMTNDFRFALEDEVRELERQTRIREEEKAAAARAAQAPPPLPEAPPDGVVPRESPSESAPITTETENRIHGGSSAAPDGDANSSNASAETVSVPHEKSSPEDNPVV